MAASNTSVGSLDLMEVPTIDTHVHPLTRNTISESYARQAKQFAELMAPADAFAGQQQQLVQHGEGFTNLVWNQSRRAGYLNYIARTYNVPATLAGFDSVTGPRIRDDADFTRYITTIFDRERIAFVVFQSREADPVAPRTAIPAGRFVWTWPFTDMLQPSWAHSNGHTRLQDVVAQIDRRLETAAANGCRGFKTGAAYSRPFNLDAVTAQDAELALQKLLSLEPHPVDDRGTPSYSDSALRAALKAYQDYLFRHVYVKAGEIGRPIILHTAVALHPHLRTEWNDPRPLYDIFMDPEIQRAGTRFVLIHSGYPSHHVVAAMISQFPNVCADVSFYAKYPAALEEIYRAFLSLGPHEKVMHGSDSNTVPEEVGYCAWNSRSVLARVLNDYRTHYGWSQADVEKSANSILHGNARRVFGEPG